MRLFDPDHGKFTKELWDYYQQHLSQLNQQTLVSLQKQQGFFIAIPANDPATFTALQSGSIESLLFDSKLARWLIRQIKPSTLQDLMVIVTFLRSPYFYTHYSAFLILAERKRDGVSNKDLPEAIQAILQPTYGFPIYLEQIAEIIVALTGYPLEYCYSLLQRLKRKSVDFTQDVEEFLAASTQHGAEREVAWGLFALLVEFAPDAGYRSTVENYVKPAYESAYLQTHHPEAYQVAKEELKHAKAKP